MKSVEEDKENLEGSGSSSVSKSSDSKSTKEPRQTKEEHDTCSTDDQSDGSFLVHLFFSTAESVPSVLDKNRDHHDKNDSIEKQDDKDGAQKSSKEYCRIRDEAAIEEGERILSITCISSMTCTILCIHQLTILGLLLWVCVQ